MIRAIAIMFMGLVSVVASGQELQGSSAKPDKIQKEDTAPVETPLSAEELRARLARLQAEKAALAREFVRDRPKLPLIKQTLFPRTPLKQPTDNREFLARIRAIIQGRVNSEQDESVSRIESQPKPGPMTLTALKDYAALIKVHESALSEGAKRALTHQLAAAESELAHLDTQIKSIEHKSPEVRRYLAAERELREIEAMFQATQTIISDEVNRPADSRTMNLDVFINLMSEHLVRAQARKVTILEERVKDLKASNDIETFCELGDKRKECIGKIGRIKNAKQKIETTLLPAEDIINLCNQVITDPAQEPHRKIGAAIGSGGAAITVDEFRKSPPGK